MFAAPPVNGSMLDEVEGEERFVCDRLKESSKKVGKLSHGEDLSRARLCV